MMKSTGAVRLHAKALPLEKPASRLERKRLTCWRVVDSRVAGYPAFRWRLTRNFGN